MNTTYARFQPQDSFYDQSPDLKKEIFMVEMTLL